VAIGPGGGDRPGPLGAASQLCIRDLSSVMEKKTVAMLNDNQLYSRLDKMHNCITAFKAMFLRKFSWSA
jgi:hypothetical protein